MIRFLNRLQPWALCLLRMSLGAAMTLDGWRTLVPASGLHRLHPLAGIDAFSHTIVRLGLPYWFGYVTVITQLLGGLMLVAGMLTRFWAFMVLLVLLAGAVANSLHHLSIAASVLFYAEIALMLLVAGSGALSLDRRLGLS